VTLADDVFGHISARLQFFSFSAVAGGSIYIFVYPEDLYKYMSTYTYICCPLTSSAGGSIYIYVTTLADDIYIYIDTYLYRSSVRHIYIYIYIYVVR